MSAARPVSESRKRETLTLVNRVIDAQTRGSVRSGRKLALP